MTTPALRETKALWFRGKYGSKAELKGIEGGSTTDQRDEPAEFKHINKRGKEPTGFLSTRVWITCDGVAQARSPARRAWEIGV
ncbi:hypothetical protein JTE90_004668 [Oedothorax gibbosus]|uniref:Uncharacterized protein n=1 Tax=Oedothorax gibbosus TaxID=931172 RepID=A0AAV6TFY2_9ARAC|nr:hypothetical protein JTE90_004668 [Oedothorax gibbosus]